MIRGTKMELAKPPTKRFDVGASIHNRFDVEVVDAVTGKIKCKAYAENTVCDSLWTYLCSNAAWNNYIHYGSGQGTPSHTDKKLFNFVGSLASTLYSEDFDHRNQIYQLTKKVVLSETTAVGATITEIGIGYSASSSSLLTHAMLKDMNGNPVSLEKTDTDIFNIYATVFCHLTLPVGCHLTGYRYGYNGNLQSSLLPHLVGQTALSAAKLFASMGYPARSGNAYTMSTAFDVSARTITFLNRLGAFDANIGGIKVLYLHTDGIVMSCEVEEENGWYERTSIVGEAIGTGDGSSQYFATKFPFAKHAILYVDGVAVDAEVSYGYSVQNIGYYMRMLEADANGAYTPSSNTVSITPFLADPATEGKFFFTGNAANKPLILENTLWETHPISKVISKGTIIKASNNLVDWVSITSNSEVSEGYRYWSLHRGITRVTVEFQCKNELPASKNIHFATPPASGSVITADYDAICVGKDENHVFDFSVMFKFNEYTE